MGTFPARRTSLAAKPILSGTERSGLVVEASENSGTRVTARCAAEQKRDCLRYGKRH